MYPHYHPFLAARDLEKFREGTPTSSEVLREHTLNFRPSFKFSRLIFLGGGPPSEFGCAIPWLGQSVERVKISGGSSP